MKKILFLLAIVATFAFVSCECKVEESTEPETTIETTVSEEQDSAIYSDEADTSTDSQFDQEQ